MLKTIFNNKNYLIEDFINEEKILINKYNKIIELYNEGLLLDDDFIYLILYINENK